MSTHHSLSLAIYIPSLKYGLGGAEHMLLNLRGEFLKRGIPTTLVLLNASSQLYQQQSLLGPTVNLYSSGMGFRSTLALANYLQNHTPDILLTSITKYNLTAIIAKRISHSKTKIVIREAASTPYSTKKFQFNSDLLLPILINKFYPYADGLISVSTGVADIISKKYRIPRERFTVIYNPTVSSTMNSFMENPVDETHIFSSDYPVIMGAGRLTEQKDFQTLIKAYSLIQKKGIKARLLILGEGPDRKNLEDLSHKLDLAHDVYMPGFKNNPYAYLARSSVFVLSSLWEGLPNVLIEAMACGTPVVATDCDSGPREILQDGKYGLLVPPGDPVKLAEAIISTLENPINKEKIISRANFFSINKISDEYLNYFNMLLYEPRNQTSV